MLLASIVVGEAADPESADSAVGLVPIVHSDQSRMRSPLYTRSFRLLLASFFDRCIFGGGSRGNIPFSIRYRGRIAGMESGIYDDGEAHKFRCSRAYRIGQRGRNAHTGG